MEMCPQSGCNRAGDDVGLCGSFLTCPAKKGQTETIDPAVTTVVRCEQCGVTRAFTAPAMVHGNTSVSKAHCQLSQETCVAYVLPLEANPAKASKPKGKKPADEVSATEAAAGEV